MARTKRTNPAAAPLLLVGAATLAVVGVSAAAYSMTMTQAKPKRRKGLPVLVGELTDTGITFRRVDDLTKIQADFLVITNASPEDWASKVSEWMYGNLNQAILDIFVGPSPVAQDLQSKLKDAWRDRATAGMGKTGKVPFKVSFVSGDQALA